MAVGTLCCRQRLRAERELFCTGLYGRLSEATEIRRKLSGPVVDTILVCHHYVDSKMFPDTTEPTEILHCVYLNAKIFPIDFPAEIVVLCHYRKLNHVYSYGHLVPSEC